MSLTVLLVPAGSDIAGRLICAAEHDAICHIAIDMHDGWTIAEEGIGCWARPVEQLNNPAIGRYELALNTTQESGMRAWLRSHVGTRYSYEAIVLDALDLAFRCHLADKHDDRYVCSSLIAKACSLVGLNLFPGRDPLTITPADWDRLASSGRATPQP